MVYYGTMENGVAAWSVEARGRCFPLYCFQQISCGQNWIYGITILAYINCYRLPVPVSAAEMLYLRYNAEVCLADSGGRAV